MEVIVEKLRALREHSDRLMGSLEVDPNRGVDAVRALKRFQSLFSGTFPVFVPPFGRLDASFIPELLI